MKSTSKEKANHTGSPKCKQNYREVASISKQDTSGSAVDQAFYSPSPAPVVSTACTIVQPQALCITQRRKSTTLTHQQLQNNRQLLLDPKTDEHVTPPPPYNMKRRRTMATRSTYTFGVLLYAIAIMLPTNIRAHETSSKYVSIARGRENFENSKTKQTEQNSNQTQRSAAVSGCGPDKGALVSNECIHWSDK